MSDQQPRFSIEKLYVKDLSLEVPNAPQIYLEREGPAIDLQLQSGSKAIGENAYEVFVTVTVTAKSADKTFFLVEAGQAGIFHIEGVPQEDLAPLLSVGHASVRFDASRPSMEHSRSPHGTQPQKRFAPGAPKISTCPGALI